MMDCWEPEDDDLSVRDFLTAVGIGALVTTAVLAVLVVLFA